MESLAGLDLKQFLEWFETVQPGRLPADASARLLAGGRSNLTYLVGGIESGVVVRRPPIGHVSSGAHDMGREVRVMSALASTAVPVPRVLAHCQDVTVTGAELYVMERVPGTAYVRADDLVALGASRTREICEAMVDTLVELHAVDPVEVGLGDFGRPGGFLRRQLSLWSRQMLATGGRPLRGAERLRDALAERVDSIASVSIEANTAAIVHGDYRIDNLLVDELGVRAVLDWELSTLGDPLTDVAALAINSDIAPVLRDVPELGDVGSAPGFLTGAEVIERYIAASGRPVGDLTFHLALSCFKSAAILEGVHRRHVDGTAVDGAFARVGQAVEPLIEQGLAQLRR
ncbi:phosphotransferase family protein [Amycolatopsis panacis]|uniref:phosphotransferase family protein n=1 Tax=Amycolatopsis panacis TaxID=2340917 RepID=UPI003898DB93